MPLMLAPYIGNGVVLKTPTADGTNGKALITDGSGNLSLTGDFSLLGHTHPADGITSGVLSTARLGSGVADGTTFLRGDSTWQTISSGVTAHNQLTGLSADDHTQYALLNGRSSGQIIHGGSGASENLTLRSTSHATKGIVQIDSRRCEQVYNGAYDLTYFGVYNNAVNGSAALHLHNTSTDPSVSLFATRYGTNTQFLMQANYGGSISSFLELSTDKLISLNHTQGQPTYAALLVGPPNVSSGTHKGIVYKAYVNQTATLFELLNSSNNSIASIASTGAYFATLGSASAVGMTVKGATSQSGKYIDLQNSSGTSLAYFNSTGRIFIPLGSSGASNGGLNFTDGTNVLYSKSSGNWNGPTVYDGRLWVAYNGLAAHSRTHLSGSLGINPTAGDSGNSVAAIDCVIPYNTWKGLQLRGAASQSANLIELQNSSGTILSYFNSSGTVFLPNTAIKFASQVADGLTYSYGSPTGGISFYIGGGSTGGAFQRNNTTGVIGLSVGGLTNGFDSYSGPTISNNSVLLHLAPGTKIIGHNSNGPQTLTIRGESNTNPNTNGADLQLQGGFSKGTGTGGSITFDVSPAGLSGSSYNAAFTILELKADKTAVWGDATNHVFGTSTGTKHGTAANQKQAWWGATPRVQPTKAAYNNWATLADVVQALVDVGLFDQV